MLPDYSVIAWLLIAFSVYLTGVSKGGFAGGFGTLSVPLMALAISPAQAAGLLLPLLLVMDVFAVKAWWGKQDATEVWRFVPGLFIGVTVGTLLFGSLSEQGLRLTLGVITLLFAAYMLLKPVAKKAHFFPLGIASGERLRLYQLYGPCGRAAAECLLTAA